MQSIWKYQMEGVDEQIIRMPDGALPLDVQVQNGMPCLWVKCNPDNSLVDRVFITHGTGHPVPETTGEYVGSYQLMDGALVFHVFEAA